MTAGRSTGAPDRGRGRSMLTRRSFGGLGIAAGAVALSPGLILPPRFAGAGAPRGVASHGISAFGELKYGPDFSHFDYVNPEAPVGGTFSTGFGGVTFDSLHPFVLKGNAAIGVSLTFDTLMTGGGDEPDAMYGLLAETAEIAEDGASVTFRLREEARFADGSPVTAEDVVWTFNTLLEKGHPSYALQFGNVTSVEALDELSVRFAFDPERPLRDMPMTVAALSILPKAWWEGRDFSDSTLDPLLASGPYEVALAEPGRRIVYRRRDDYWGWDLPVNRGRYNFGEIRIEYFRDRSAGFEGFKGGAYTFNEEFWSKLWATAYNFPAIERGDVVKETLPDNRPAGTQGYWFNLRREKFADARTREAIASVFDFEWSNRTLFFDLYTRTDSFFEGGGVLEAADAPSPAEIALLEPKASDLPPGVLESKAYVPPVTDGSGRPRRTLRAAAKLLDEAGWTIQDGVRRNADGETLTVEFLLVGEGFERITTPYLKNLERIGVQGSVRTVDPASYKQRTDDFDFDLTVSRFAMSLTPGVELRDMFHSESVQSPGSDNLAGVSSPVVDSLIEVIERAQSREELNTAVSALDRVLRAMHIWVPQWSKAAHHIAYWDVYGKPQGKPAYSRGVIDTWWIDPEKQARLEDQVGN
ncbi:MAG: extracellular solute-binding protein [Pseudomonadota bacterium]